MRREVFASGLRCLEAVSPSLISYFEHGTLFIFLLPRVLQDQWRSICQGAGLEDQHEAVVV